MKLNEVINSLEPITRIKYEKKYKCKAHITYEFNVTAISKEEAQNNVFETIADDIAKGIIPMDIYDSDDCFPIPLLVSLDFVLVDLINK